jgi:hypothetical protein
MSVRKVDMEARRFMFYQDVGQLGEGLRASSHYQASLLRCP